MKKNITLVLVSLLVLSGCGSNGSNSGSSLIDKSLNANDLSIDDYEIETKKIRDSGYELYASTLKNNSEYSIAGFEIKFCPKQDISESQLSIYNDFMKSHKEYLKDVSITEVMLRGDVEQLVKKGESTTKVPLAIGCKNLSWYDIPNEKQYSLMEPKEIQLGVIGKDNKLYIAYYDYKNKEWTLDEQNKELNTWPENNISKIISKPECEYYNLLSDMDDDDDLNFHAYGISNDYYKEYIESIKKAGFTKDPYESKTSYSADNQEDKYISISYEEKTKVMTVSVY